MLCLVRPMVILQLQLDYEQRAVCDAVEQHAVERYTVLGGSRAVAYVNAAALAVLAAAAAVTVAATTSTAVTAV
jgi:hypothetical protein